MLTKSGACRSVRAYYTKELGLNKFGEEPVYWKS
jgi:hypothetical protein